MKMIFFEGVDSKDDFIAQTQNEASPGLREFTCNCSL